MMQQFWGQGRPTARDATNTVGYGFSEISVCLYVVGAGESELECLQT